MVRRLLRSSLSPPGVDAGEVGVGVGVDVDVAVGVSVTVTDAVGVSDPIAGGVGVDPELGTVVSIVMVLFARFGSGEAASMLTVFRSVLPGIALRSTCTVKKKNG